MKPNDMSTLALLAQRSSDVTVTLSELPLEADEAKAVAKVLLSKHADSTPAGRIAAGLVAWAESLKPRTK